MKKPKVDGKLRVGGGTKIHHGARGGGVPAHTMSDGTHHVGHIPPDVNKFDQDHGVAPGAGKKGDGK
jgi:hypothetical protein